MKFHEFTTFFRTAALLGAAGTADVATAFLRAALAAADAEEEEEEEDSNDDEQHCQPVWGKPGRYIIKEMMGALWGCNKDSLMKDMPVCGAYGKQWAWLPCQNLQTCLQEHPQCKNTPRYPTTSPHWSPDLLLFTGNRTQLSFNHFTDQVWALTWLMKHQTMLDESV